MKTTYRPIKYRQVFLLLIILFQAKMTCAVDMDTYFKNVMNIKGDYIRMSNLTRRLKKPDVSTDYLTATYINTIGKDGKTPLQLATSPRVFESTDNLREDSDHLIQAKRLIFELVKFKNLDINQTINPKDSPEKQRTALTRYICSIKKDDISEKKKKIIKALVSHPDINVNQKDQNGKTALIYLILYSVILDLTYLPQEKIDLTVKYTIDHDDETSKFSLHQGTALMCAIMLGDKGKAFKLIGIHNSNSEKLNHINLQDQDGKTALMHAIERKSDINEVIKPILNSPTFDVDIVDDNKRTPLHYAALHYHKNIFDLVLQKTPPKKLNLQDEQSLTPIMILTAQGHYNAIEKLLNKCSDAKKAINVKGPDDITALSILVAKYIDLSSHNSIDLNNKNNCKKMINLFLKNGADPTLTFQDEEDHQKNSYQFNYR